MFQIEMAGLVFRIENRFEYVQNLCKNYIISKEQPADIIISVSEKELRHEIEKTPECFWDDAYAEGVVIYEKISNALPAFDAFIMHSSAVSVDGLAYSFAAKSGTGKSTHTRYWKEILGDRVIVINGDKPIYRFIGNKLIAYGTPWCGKENWQTNTAAPLKALCLLKQEKENTIYPVNASDTLKELVQHFHLAGGNQVDIIRLMELIDRMFTMVPLYRLCCRNDITAAETAVDYFGLRTEEKRCESKKDMS